MIILLTNFVTVNIVTYQQLMVRLLFRVDSFQCESSADTSLHYQILFQLNHTPSAGSS